MAKPTRQWPAPTAGSDLFMSAIQGLDFWGVQEHAGLRWNNGESNEEENGK